MLKQTSRGTRLLAAMVGLGLLAGGARVAVAAVSRWCGDGNARDVLGEHDGRLVNGAHFGPAIKGEGFYFDGQDDAVSVADTEALRLTKSVTLSAWVRADAYPPEGQDFGFVVFRGDDRPGLDPYYLGLRTDGKMVFGLTGEDGTAVLKAPFPLGKFVQVVASLDDRTGLMRLTLDDEVVAETVTGVRPFHDLEPSANPGIGIGNHTSQPNSQYNMPFCGVLDEVMISSHTTLAPVDLQVTAGPLGSYTGRVVLGTPAPKGGADVALGTTDPELTVPPHVTVPEGQRILAFRVTGIAAIPSATINATFNGITRSSALHPTK